MLLTLSFKSLNTITLTAVFVLLLIGSLVRSMGAGMGCPDWPKCFGRYVPPTSQEQLPSNYQEIFQKKRLAKNQRLAKYFYRLGYDQLAFKLVNDPAVQQEQTFDTTKAWMEYINRLIGALIGLLVFFNMIFAFSIKTNPRIPMIGTGIFILTGLQGWIGSLVVSTNLLKGFITLHMLLTLLILALLIWMNVNIRKMKKIVDRPLFILSIILFLLVISQIILGTEVRSIIDPLLATESNRSDWTNALTRIFYIHRSYSWFILAGAIGIYYMVRIHNHQLLQLPAILLISQVVLAAVVGIIMVEFNFPFWAQSLHLLLVAGIFSILFYLSLRLKIV